jgi:serine O-acetyltransferase
MTTTPALTIDAKKERPEDARPPGRLAQAAQQCGFFYGEMSAGKTGWRGLVSFAANCFRGGRMVVAAYRCKRFWYLLLGRAHWASWLFMWPVYVWCRQIGGRHEIRPEAPIGPGFRVIHCSLPVIIGPFAAAGRNLYLTGGNVIGRRRINLQSGAIRLGDDVMLGINAMVVGPLVIGDRVRVGAGVIVLKDVPAGARVVGPPARVILPESGA